MATPTPPLAGRKAFVTGGAKGIGAAIARRLAADGALVTIADLDIDAAQTLANSIWARAVRLDVADLAQVAAALAEHGPVDILVNNAGVDQHAFFTRTTPEDWRRLIAINLESVFATTHAALPAMQAAGWGRIINVASVHGLVGSAEKSAYVAAKHGIVGLTKVTALETATSGVTCNAICPGWVLTPLVQKQVDAKAAALGLSNEDAKKQLLGEKEPSMQFTTPEELGELAAFFCSAAGNNIRGVAWNMDGGWTAQ